MRKLIAILLFGVFASVAWAQLPMHAPPLGTASPTSTYVGIGDVKSGANAYWALRAYNRAYAVAHGNSAIIKRASDSTLKTITVLSNGNFDTSTATTFCNATTCVVTQLYDQTGNNNHMTVGAGNSAVPLAFSCIGSLPCLQTPGPSTPDSLNDGPGSSTAQPFTYILGGIERTGHFTTSQVLMEGGASPTNAGIEFSTSANTMLIFAGSSVTHAANDSTLHCIQGVFNGASSIFSIDNSNTTVSPGTRNTLNIWLFEFGSGGSFQVQGNFFEAGFYTSALSTTENTNIYNNQHAYGLC